MRANRQLHRDRFVPFSRPFKGPPLTFSRTDWIHDTIKHSLRLRRLRRLKRTQGLRGQLINLWDGFQGWLLVTIVGFVTACIAFSIIRAEMWLFDLKEGYCATGWTRAKRFCCRAESAPEKAFGTFVLRGWAPIALEEGGECEAWTTWVAVWRKWTGEGEGAGEAASYIAYIAIAVRSRLSLPIILILTFATTARLRRARLRPDHLLHRLDLRLFLERLARFAPPRQHRQARRRARSVCLTARLDQQVRRD